MKVWVWHNLGCDLDVVEYIQGKMYGVITYKQGLPHTIENRVWLATMMTYEEMWVYIDWCDFQCDKEIYNRITKKTDEDDWV
jgi:hypothetical protein